MVRLLTACALTLLVSAASFSQDDDSTFEAPHYYHRTKTKVGGAGGFTPAWALFNFDAINKVLPAGMPAFKNQPMYLAGGEGYGYIMFLKNVRMGGLGMEGTVSTTQYDPSTNIMKNVDYHVSYGGFLVDYVVPIAEGFDCAVGVTIGGGSIDITTTSDDGRYKQWSQIWNEFGNNDSTINVTRHLNGSFFVLQPRFNVEYALLRWFQLRVGVSYPTMSAASWKLEDDKDILGVPDNLKTNGPVITAGIMFGFFN
ncbi:MAG TPA: hypothetical protein VMG34_15685 [Bacteroidota bacterium]|nr:hypothetical protein [Bacteroidota bacterium]